MIKKFPKIYHVNHHLSHASTAYYLSSFKKAAFLTCDFKGEKIIAPHGDTLQIIKSKFWIVKIYLIHWAFYMQRLQHYLATHLIVTSGK